MEALNPLSTGVQLTLQMCYVHGAVVTHGIWAA